MLVKREQSAPFVFSCAESYNQNFETRKVFMRSIITLFASISCVVACNAVSPADASMASDSAELIQSVSFTEFNGSWFGLNGDPNNSSGNEQRVPEWRKFLQNNTLLSDVLIFEEIVDINLLTSSVLNDKYTCQTFTRSNPKIQHVVICVKPQLRLDVADDANSYALEQVDVTGTLRPAVHGILKTQDGRRLAHIFGVHLKANSDMSATRLKQTQIIADYIKNQKAHDPVIIMGDFNTFGTDPASMENQFKVDNLVELSLPEPYTWASVTENFPPAKLDRVWLSDALVSHVSYAHVIGPCSSGDTSAIASYNNKVSDHCPTKMVISF